MATIVTAVSVRDEAVLPKAVCAALNVLPGDAIRFIIEGDRVTVEKQEQASDDPFHGFTEWGSAEDEVAFADL